jgi:hypothetical protein
VLDLFLLNESFEMHIKKKTKQNKILEDVILHVKEGLPVLDF